MKILFVAMAESVHTARWISQIQDQGWDIHLFPSANENTISPDLRDVTIHHSIYTSIKHAHPSVKHRGIRLWSPVKNQVVGDVLRDSLQKIYTSYRVRRLTRLIKKLKPDIIHTLEFQHAGYLMLEVWNRLDGNYPTWIASSWGNDLYLFGRLKEHGSKIREMLSHVNYYISDCKRDIPLVKEYGFKGEVLGSFLGGGGYELEKLPDLTTLTKPSARKVLLVKGRQTFAGRALFILSALRRYVDILHDYEIVVYFASNDVAIETQLLAQDTGLNVTLFQNVEHEKWLDLLSRARANIGVSISDGTPLSMLESLLFGTFPIQTHTACVDEWLEDGKTGIVIHDERNIDEIAEAIRRAITDDELVDQAAELNRKVAIERLDYNKIKPQVVALYQKVYNDD